MAVLGRHRRHCRVVVQEVPELVHEADLRCGRGPHHLGEASNQRGLGNGQIPVLTALLCPRQHPDVAIGQGVQRRQLVIARGLWRRNCGHSRQLLRHGFESCEHDCLARGRISRGFHPLATGLAVLTVISRYALDQKPIRHRVRHVVRGRVAL